MEKHDLLVLLVEHVRQLSEQFAQKLENGEDPGDDYEGVWTTHFRMAGEALVHVQLARNIIPALMRYDSDDILPVGILYEQGSATELHKLRISNGRLHWEKVIAFKMTFLSRYRLDEAAAREMLGYEFTTVEDGGNE